jgi:hypothetical protein
MHGRLQLCVKGSEQSHHAYVTVSPSGASPHAGLALDARAWLVVQETPIAAWLGGGRLPQNALEVLGDRDFALALLQLLASSPRAGSPLQIRLQR